MEWETPSFVEVPRSGRYRPARGYRITHCDSGTVYVGITVLSVKDRFRAHCKSTSGCLYLKNALAKHGRGAFSVESVAEFETWFEACEWESSEITRLRAAGIAIYNLTDGGDGAPGVVIGSQARQKLSKIHKGRPKSDTHRAKMIARHVGAKRSPEARARMSAAAKRRTLDHLRTPEVRAKVRATLAAKKAAQRRGN